MLTKEQALLDPIFVFGSNLLGHHGAGAALYAVQNYGAEYGVGIGPTGQSYAIPTKDHRINTLPLEAIQWYVLAFMAYAFKHPELDFNVTAIGCGLAGYEPYDIAPLFKGAPDNVHLPIGWHKCCPTCGALAGYMCPDSCGSNS